MAIVLSVHLVESIWSRSKQSGVLAPYLVVDHNGQQQQTDIVRAASVTAWNQKAAFPYVPTSDLVIMAFDAGRHSGAFMAQATVDVASMLQAGTLSASAPLVNSTGTTIGHVLFDVELSTTSLGIAASLDIPGLTVTASQQSRMHSSRQMQPAAGSRPADHLQEEHLSGSFTAFTMPSVQQALAQQQKVQQHHAGSSDPAHGSAVAAVAEQQQPQLTRQLTRQFSQQIARGAHGLGSMLGLSMKRRSIEEPAFAAAAAAAAPRPVSPFAAMAGSAAAAAPGLPADVQASFDSAPESGGPLPCSLMAKRNSYLSSSNSFSSATAPPLPPGFAAAAQAAAPVRAVGHAPAAAAAAGAAGMGATGSVQLLAGGGRMLQQRSRYSSRASDSSSVQYTSNEAAAEGRTPAGLQASCSFSSSSAAADHHQQQQQRRHQQQHPAGMLSVGGQPGTAGEALSPLRSSRRQLKLSPSKAVQQVAVQHQQLLQARQQDERVLQQAAEALQQLQENGAARDSRAWDDELAREYDDADAADKEAILYRQLTQQQAQEQAGATQVLNEIAAQQQLEAVRSSQLLAALNAMGSDSPRHIRALAEALAASIKEDGGFKEQQQQQQQGFQMQQQAKAAVTAAVTRDEQSTWPASPTRSAGCYAEELRGSLSNSMSASAASSPRKGLSALAAAGLQQLSLPTTPCTPEFASPEMSFRTSYASSTSPLQAGISAARGAGSHRASSCSTASHSSAAVPPPAGAAGLARLNDGSSGSMPASCSSPVGRNSAASGSSSSSSSSSKNRYYPEVPNREVELESPKRAGRKQWSVARAAGREEPSNDRTAFAAPRMDTWQGYEVSGSSAPVPTAAEAEDAAAADNGAGVHDRSWSAGASRRKSRFNQQPSIGVSAGIQARSSVKSFPLANLELESEISEVIAASSPKSAAAASPQSSRHPALHVSTARTPAAPAPASPAYRCAESVTGQDSGYCFVRDGEAAAAAAANKADRWCMHDWAGAAPYLRQPPAFPFQRVPVGPSAPMG